MDHVDKSFRQKLDAKGSGTSTVDAPYWRYGSVGEFHQLLSMK